MDEKTARALTVECGRELLEKGLVARTWGNVSCRLDTDTMVITPSGMDYKAITENDIVSVRLSDGTWDGERKPSGERGVHIAAYRCFTDVGFVIHTHQVAASALSLVGFDSLQITDAEREKLGGIALAGYGLPGTGKLTDNVRQALAKGNHTVLMAKHGALICAATKDEAMEMAFVLEEVCNRNLKCHFEYIPQEPSRVDMEMVRLVYPMADYVSSPALLTWAEKGRGIRAQLDDMAQMIGVRIPCVKGTEGVIRKLERKNAVLVPRFGAVVNAEDSDDVEALKLLCEKSAVCALHVRAWGKRCVVGLAGVLLMRAVYTLKYSKQKG